MIRKGLLLFSFCGFASLGLLFLDSAPRNPMTLSELDKILGTKLPQGSDRKSVEGWLNAQRYRRQHRDGANDRKSGGAVLKKGQQGSQSGEYVHATIQNTRRSWPGVYVIFMDFYFDKNEKLIGYMLREKKFEK